MPKKHNHHIHIPQSSGYVHPSLSSSKSTAEPAARPVSVDDRLARLRKEAPPSEITRLQKDVASGSHQRSVPPAVSGLLGLPQIAPPAPTPGTRARLPLRLTTPGPAPPRSWLKTGGSPSSSPSSRNGSAESSPSGSRRRPHGASEFHRCIGADVVTKGSLLHNCLRTIAQIWQDLGDDALVYLSQCPQTIRSALISYISSYGSENGLSARELACLMPELGHESTADLMGLVGWTVSLKDVGRIVRDKTKALETVKTDAEDDISESWDDEPSTIPRSLPSNTTITGLSLADPPSTISWLDLLNLTSHTPTLTHLSLAGWPYPTKTPNLAASFFTAANGVRIPVGGSNVYSSLDGDHAEAGVLLRQLSRNTYCLEYLDLSGCTWTPALLPQETIEETTRFLALRSREGRAGTQDWDTRSSRSSGPEWTGGWARMTQIKIAQTAQPRSLSLIRTTALHSPLRSLMPGGLEQDLRQYFSNTRDPFSRADFRELWRAPQHRTTCSACRSVFGTAKEGDCRVCEAWIGQMELRQMRWADVESGLRDVGRTLQGLRRAAGGQVLKVDYGWLSK